MAYVIFNKQSKSWLSLLEKTIIVDFSAVESRPNVCYSTNLDGCTRLNSLHQAELVLKWLMNKDCEIHVLELTSKVYN